ncbi:glycoside hydrolase family 19 protein [Amycolatopsis sp. NPDC051045]|uniref:glycoside hydrolase family 19 protein n=1 Tax=Amycolatopsis sp. NPDC051045 TaxID=3156922 RepID=UPI003442E384
MSKPLRTTLALAVSAGLLVVPAPPATAATGQEDRIAVLEGDTLFVKEGGLDADWERQESDVKKFQLDGDRIAVLKNDGSLLVKEGDLGPDWYTVDADSVTDFQIRDGRIAFTEGPDLYVVDGELDGEVVHQDAVVKSFRIEGDRIGVLTTDNVLQVKEGDLGPDWAVISENNVTDFQLEDSRIAYTEGTELWAQEGELDAESILQESDVKKFALSGDRIGALQNDGLLQVKGGDLEPGWDEIAGGVTDFKLDGDRIGYLEGTDLWAQEGELDAESFRQEEGVSAFDLVGDRVAVVKNGELLVKEGDLEPGWFTADEDSATGVQLLAAPRHGGGGGTLVTLDDLTAIYGFLREEDIVAEGLDSLNQAMAEGEITNPARIAAFLATLRNESGFRYNAGEDGQTVPYLGRGYIQLTGSANYGAASGYVGHDLLADPEAAASLQYSAQIAKWYWTEARSDSNNAADNLNMGLVDAYIGYAKDAREDGERCSDFEAALRYFNGGELPDGHINCVRP